MGPRNEQLVFNSVLNFKRVIYFVLCLIETQVSHVLERSTQNANDLSRAHFNQLSQGLEGQGSVRRLSAGWVSEVPLVCNSGVGFPSHLNCRLRPYSL